MLTLVLAMFCTMPSNAERAEILRDAMVLEGFDKAIGMSEAMMLEYAYEQGFDIMSTFEDAQINAHECY